MIVWEHFEAVVCLFVASRSVRKDQFINENRQKSYTDYTTSGESDVAGNGFTLFSFCTGGEAFVTAETVSGSIDAIDTSRSDVFIRMITVITAPSDLEEGRFGERVVVFFNENWSGRNPLPGVMHGS